jgi:predicted Zn-dependent protease
LRPSAAEAEGRPIEFLASHPATPDRIRAAQAAARQFTAPAAARDRDAYLAGVEGLVYGEDPSEGFVRGRRFLHPKLGLTFTAPPGFSLENTPQAVLGAKAGGAQVLRLDVVRVPAEQTLAAYLTSGWIENVDQSSLENLTINGFSAATAIARGSPWTFRIYAVRFGSDVFRIIYAAKGELREADAAFAESINTFRRMSLAEIDSARPLRIALVTVARGDSVEKLAERMAVSDRKMERFRVLNGLAPNAPVRPGERVKIVVE